MKKEKAFSSVKGILLIVLFVLVASVIVFAVIALCSASSVANPKKAEMTTFPDELGLQYKFCEIPAPDGSVMASWFIYAQKRNSETVSASEKTVVFSHDYKSNKDMEEINALYYARYLCEAGYNVLTFDYSGSGSSTGGGYTFGSREVEELNAVVSYAKNTLGSTEISLCGWGYGAAVAVMAGAENESVSAIISDGSYADMRDFFSQKLNYISNMPSVFNGITEVLLPMFTHRPLYGDSPLAAVKRAEGKRFFFIQGQTDDLFSPDSVNVLSAAAGNKNTVEKWQVAGCDHIYAFKIDEENYVDRTVRFLNGESVFGG